MAKFERFEDIDIWKIAKLIAVEAYRISEKEPLKSDWGLKDQFRRSAMSMSDNIAEGFEYNHNPDFVKFLRYAKGSSGEFRNKVIVMKEIDYMDSSDYEKLYQLSREFSGKTKKLIDYLKAFELKKKRNNL